MRSSSSVKYIHHYNIDILNISDPEMQLINIKRIVKWIEKKKFKVLDYKKRNNFKIFYSSAILIASKSDIMVEIALKQKVKKSCSWRLDCLGCN